MIVAVSRNLINPKHFLLTSHTHTGYFMLFNIKLGPELLRLDNFRADRTPAGFNTA